MKMNRGGDDRRRYGRDGFGVGRQGRGDGRIGARGNVGERVKHVEDQLGPD